MKSDTRNAYARRIDAVLARLRLSRALHLLGAAEADRKSVV
mgnify:CR=1 FL=1